MAGDWIKMRTDLYRDPKVCAIADQLMHQKGELAEYVNQNCQRAMTVTRNVMRNVTVGALVSVWGVMRLRGKRINDDLVFKSGALWIIDDLAELPGFGQAMADVGWVVADESGIVFPNFFSEYNVDPNEDAKLKNAERQRKYREKQRQESNVTDNVTVTSQNNTEKRREEKSINTPIPPKGADAGALPEKQKTPAIALPTWLEAIKASSEKPIPEDDPVFVYAEQVGIPPDHLRLCWREFRDRYSQPGATRYRDWRGVFRKAVRGNWFKLWWVDADGQYMLTTCGKQAEMAAKQ